MLAIEFGAALSRSRVRASVGFGNRESSEFFPRREIGYEFGPLLGTPEQEDRQYA